MDLNTRLLTNANNGAAIDVSLTDMGVKSAAQHAAADFLSAAATASGLAPMYLRLSSGLNTDGSGLAAAAAAGKFGYAITLGTSIALVGEVSNNNTKTDDALFEYVLPANYVAGQNLTVTINAAISTAGAPTYAAKTAEIKAYRTAKDGTQGADIGPGAASAITVAGADIAFVITGTTLSPGDRIVFELEAVLHDTGAVACNVVINSIRVA